MRNPEQSEGSTRQSAAESEDIVHKPFYPYPNSHSVNFEGHRRPGQKSLGRYFPAGFPLQLVEAIRVAPD
jgi:hypothetical protein